MSVPSETVRPRLLSSDSHPTGRPEACNRLPMEQADSPAVSPLFSRQSGAQQVKLCDQSTAYGGEVKVVIDVLCHVGSVPAQGTRLLQRSMSAGFVMLRPSAVNKMPVAGIKLLQ